MGTVLPMGSDRGNKDEHNDLSKLLAKLTSGPLDKDSLFKFAKALPKSLRVQRGGVTLSGQGLADLLLKTAPRIPIRSKAEIEKANPGLSGTALANQLAKNAARNSAAVGGVTGALASAGELAPPLWVMLPLEVIAETLVIAAIEMKLVGELHELYEKPISGTPDERAVAILESWSARKGVDIDELRKKGTLSEALDKKSNMSIGKIIKRKLMLRTARNVSSLAPLFIGAVAGAELNRRSTRDIGGQIIKDLAALKKRG